MNSRQHLSADIDRINKVLRRLGPGVWAVAAFVMAYGIPVSYGTLAHHGIPKQVAWMPSLAADCAMSVAIIAGPVLANYAIRSGWIGILRWTAAFTTWALQTAGAWLAPNRPDWAGVGLHSLPPCLLFVVAEGASYFVRRMSGVLTAKRAELAMAEQMDADTRAQRAEIDARLRSTTAELTAARAEITALTERLTAAIENIDAEKAAATLAAERYEAEIGSLRTALTAQAEKLADSDAKWAEKLAASDAKWAEKFTDEHTASDAKWAEKLAASDAKWAEKLAKARAERKTVNLTAYREKHAGKSSPQPSNRPAMSDEDAVQAMFETHSDPEHEWSQNSVRTLTGAGFGRIPNLIVAWRERALREADGEAAVNE